LNLATGCPGWIEGHEPKDNRRFDRRGRELGLAARPRLVLSRGESTGIQHNKKQNKKTIYTVIFTKPESAGNDYWILDVFSSHPRPLQSGQSRLRLSTFLSLSQLSTIN
jgi:hypothetical protein